MLATMLATPTYNETPSPHCLHPALSSMPPWWTVPILNLTCYETDSCATHRVITKFSTDKYERFALVGAAYIDWLCSAGKSRITWKIVG